MLTVVRSGSVAVILLNHPPVNAWSFALRKAFADAYGDLVQDRGVEAVVISGDGSTFCAGADLSEFHTDDAYAKPNLRDIVAMLYGSAKPTIAAINGAALGGGVEVALACHYRFANESARIGLPEVHLGLLPGAGGTQALPRIAGPKVALDMIVSGATVASRTARAANIVDGVHIGDGDFIAAAVQFATDILQRGGDLQNISELNVDTHDLAPDFFDTYRASIARRTAGFLAPEKCIQAVKAACELSFEEGLKRETELFDECQASPQARALQHLFFAQREAARIPGVAVDTPLRDINKVAIIGSGTMGGGVAMNFVNAGIETVILDLDDAALTRGLANVRKNYEISVKKGRMSEEQLESCMDLLSTTTDYADLSDVDLVIEAVFEDMAVKKQVFESLDAVCKKGAILATNTSTLDVNEIASVVSRPQDLVGLHFFSPANVMRLLEIVRAEHTAPDVIATSLNLAKRIRKQAVVVGVCFGFVGNRMFEPYLREAHRLVLEGATPAQIDCVLTEFGMAMGPLSVCDLAGNDIGFAVRESRRTEIAHDAGYNLLGDRLVALGRLGQKAGRGFYVYDGRNRLDDPAVIELAAEIADELGIERRSINDQEILERCLYPLINEGADILDEGIAYRSGDTDLVWTDGYGFPAWRGGPMQYADEVGTATILEKLEHYRKELGEYGEMWFGPSPLIRRLVESNEPLSTFRNH